MLTCIVDMPCLFAEQLGDFSRSVLCWPLEIKINNIQDRQNWASGLVNGSRRLSTDRKKKEKLNKKWREAMHELTRKQEEGGRTEMVRRGAYYRVRSCFGSTASRTRTSQQGRSLNSLIGTFDRVDPITKAGSTLRHIFPAQKTHIPRASCPMLA